MARLLKATRRAAATLLEDPDPDTPPPPEPTLTEERKKITRVAVHRYRDQLMPWKVLAAAVFGALLVHNADWHPFGVAVWAVLLAGGAYAFTEFRLSWRPTDRRFRFHWRNPTGGGLRRINQRALRSAWCGFGVGVWLLAVCVTTPGTWPGTIVWLAGAAVWATVSHHGWWRPADMVVDAEFTVDAPAVDSDDEPTQVIPATASARPGPREENLIPVPRAARAAGITIPAGPVDMPHPKVTLPGTDMLAKKATGRVDADDDLTLVIQAKIDEHNVKAKVVEAVRSPAITRYGIQPEPGQRVAGVMKLQHDIAMACGTSTVRMLNPIEGRPLIGVEVPNRNPETVTLGEGLASPEALRDPHPLLVFLGKDTDGNYRFLNLAKGPHVLLAGASGGGKSGGLAAIIISILSRAMPDEVTFVLIDPKQVELTRYDGIPHLAMRPVTKVDQSIAALDWVIEEMEKRYADMSAAGVRHIDDYNTGVLTGKITAPRGSRRVLTAYPYLLTIADEFGDLLLAGGDEVEERFIKIGALGRAAGVHLVLATQRPAVEIVTNKIKANIPVRIAYKTASVADSRVILDKPGAEKLRGKGDMLVKLADSEVHVRVQGAWTSDPEIDAYVKYWRDEAAAAGLTVPEVMLAERVDDQQQAAPTGRVTARDVVYDAAVRHANDDGEVDKSSIEAATPGVGEKSRDAALTRLVSDGLLTRVYKGRYKIVPQSAPEEGITQ